LLYLIMRYLIYSSFKLILIFWLQFVGISSVKGQAATNVRLIPSVSFGYTFGKGVNVGLGGAVSLLDYKISNVESYLGFDISYAVFSHERKLYKNGFYRAFSINILNVVNEMVITKIGMTRTKLKWGLNNVNKNFSNGWGINLDIAVKPAVYSPHLGFRYFAINNPCLGIGPTNPKFLYVGYQYPFLIYDGEL
jgi:hypothetical protein